MMNCFKCNHSTSQTSNFCSNCGEKINSKYRNKTASSDILILLVVSYMCIDRIYWAIIPKLLPNWLEALKLPNTFLNFMWGLIPLGLAFASKNNSIKIILIILGALYTTYTIFEIIQSFTKPNDFQYFQF